MTKVPHLSILQAVKVFRCMVSRRRMYCADNHFFRAIEYWDWMYGPDTIRAYKPKSQQDEIGRPGVASFDGQVRLTVDERRLASARRGCGFSNTLVAHEISHLALGHTRKSAKITNFIMAEGSFGKAVIPKSLQEEEANFGAICFQCGVALSHGGVTARELGRRAYADVAMVQKAQRLVQTHIFQQELWRPKPDFLFHLM